MKPPKFFSPSRIPLCLLALMLLCWSSFTARSSFDDDISHIIKVVLFVKNMLLNMTLWHHKPVLVTDLIFWNNAQSNEKSY